MSILQLRFVKVCLIMDYDALVYTGGADIKPSLISEISRGKLLLGNNPRTLCAVRNPSMLNDVCLKSGINFPQMLGLTEQLIGEKSSAVRDFNGVAIFILLLSLRKILWVKLLLVGGRS